MFNKNVWITSLLVFVLIFEIKPVQADVLGTGFTYQGSLTMSNAPANGSFDFEFALYDALSGGTEIGATITLDDVTVINGVFSVELDFGNLPFVGEQVWIDIAVREGASTGGFTGLLPRQKITATPYALHAEMVAVDSIGSAEINTNSVGSSEIISSQVQRRVNGSCATGNFSTGINQDGTMDCAADQVGVDASGAVAAVLAADGSGSGLDADLLDGQNATQIIESSRIGTVIDSLPFEITQPGRYYFVDNLTYSVTAGEAIHVKADDVTIDMNGFVMTGPGRTGNTTTAIQVQSGRDRLTFMNGSINKFGGYGIISSNIFAAGNRIERMKISRIGKRAIWFAGVGTVINDTFVEYTDGDEGISFSSGVIRNSTVANATNKAIVTNNGVVVDCTVFSAGGTPLSLGTNAISERFVSH